MKIFNHSKPSQIASDSKFFKYPFFLETQNYSSSVTCFPN